MRVPVRIISMALDLPTVLIRRCVAPIPVAAGQCPRQMMLYLPESIAIMAWPYIPAFVLRCLQISLPWPPQWCIADDQDSKRPPSLRCVVMSSGDVCQIAPRLHGAIMQSGIAERFKHDDVMKSSCCGNDSMERVPGITPKLSSGCRNTTPISVHLAVQVIARPLASDAFNCP